MKYLIYSILMACMVMTSCTKSDFEGARGNENGMDEQTGYVVKVQRSNEGVTVTQVPISDLFGNESEILYYGNGNGNGSPPIPKANGHFSSTWADTVSFHMLATSNNTNLHGNLNWWGDWWVFEGEATCGWLLENDAVLVYEITEVLDNGGEEWEDFVLEGNWVIFRVEDNGEGFNAPPDGFNDYLYFYTEDNVNNIGPVCDYPWYHNSLWSFPNGAILNGQIQVNNPF